MSKRDILRMCVQNLRRRKSRTFLTVLGVVIGCCSIVIMVSLGIGMKQSQEKMLSQMGDLTIISVSPPQGGKGKTKLDDAAVHSFQKIAGVEAVTPKLTMESLTFKLYAGAGNRYVCQWCSGAGMNQDELSKMGYQILEGKGPTKSNDILVGQYLAYSFADSYRPEGSNTIDRYAAMGDSMPSMAGEGSSVLGGGGTNPQPAQPTLPDPYFDPLKTPLTLEVDTGNGKFTVPLNPVGKVKEDYAKGEETSEGMIFRLGDLKAILEKAQTSGKKPLNYSTVLVKVGNISQVLQAENEIKAMGYNTSSMESIRKPMEKEARQKQLMLGGLGAISLFVAALGITNTMIMSISERTREIGIMKALGCYVSDVRLLFLSEAGAIGLLGGLFGCLISFLASVIINLVSLGGGFSLAALSAAALGGEGVSRLSVIPPWLLGFAVLFSIAIGLSSGYYPANKAVKIPALEAIKSE